MKAVVIIFLFTAFLQNIPAQNEYLKSDVLLVKYETRIGENGFYYSVTNLTQDTLKNVSISYKYFDIKTLSLFSAGNQLITAPEILLQEANLNMKKLPLLK